MPSETRIPRSQLKLAPGETLCDHCTALCCKYFAHELDRPTRRADYEMLRWFLLHGQTTVLADDDKWFLVVHTVCKELRPDNRCGIYATRPPICREYSTEDCDYEEGQHDRYFETPEQMEEYMEAILEPAEGRERPQPPPRAPAGAVMTDDADAPQPDDTPSPQRIEPRTLRGFRDYLPQAMIPRERMIETVRRVYRSYGFSPIDTPALEYLEILTGKGGEETDKQLYKFQDQGGRWVGMRFDLTVPLARFAAQHINELGTPFKRYHIATVWRGENTQRGRYREFMQCDFDTIGTKAAAADIETALVIHDLFVALGFEGFSIRVNNRMVLNGLLEKLGLADKSAAILRALDKLAKIGRQRVAEEMTSAAGATPQQAESVLKLAALSGTNDQVLMDLSPFMAGSETGQAGQARLAELLAAVRAVGVPESQIKLDVSIARGLDYYTGTIFETFLDALPTIGSVCSGGRYDNLAALYTKVELPGIGASLGLDRLLAAMEELKMIEQVTTPAQVFIPYFDESRLHDYLRLAAWVRGQTYQDESGVERPIGVEVFPEPKKLGQQLKYADRRGFRVALIAGQREFDAGACQVKDLATGGSVTASLANSAAEVIAHVPRPA